MINVPFNSRNLTLKELGQSDIVSLIDFIKDDESNCIKWLIPHRINDGTKSDKEYASELIDFYRRISRRGLLNSIQILHVYQKHTQKIIGVCNIWRDTQGSPRVATYITPKYRRKKYGSESQFATLKQICAQNPKLSILFAQVEPENKASHRKMLSNGFKKVGSRTFSAPGYTDSAPWLTFARKPIKFKPRTPC